VSIATGGIWSGGSGTFDPDNTTLNPAYTPSAAEIAAGTVTLTLTTTGNGNCLAVSDQMVITIAPAPVVNAGPDMVICANNNQIQLNGSVLNAGGGQWSGGLGTFNPGNNVINALYTPTLAEVVSGQITLTLTSTGNAGCLPVADQMVVTFTPAPTANAGADITTCASSPAVTLNGSFTVATGAEWSGGAGTFTPHPLAMNATYMPTAAEIAAGSVTLTLTTTGNGNCNAVSDEVLITFNPVPSVNAGANLVSCANNPTVQLNGSFSNAAGVQWSGGTGFFNPSNTTPNATYTPSAVEIQNGFVNLTLSTTGNGACNPATSSVNITINPSPVVNAGADFSQCANNLATALSGSVSFAGGGVWSGGAGTFNPGPNNLNSLYQPTAAELAQGFVVLTLTSTGNGTCNAVNDQVTITYTPAPTIDAGVDMAVCANNASVQLSGSFTLAEGAIWSGGTGSFSPASTTSNAVYTPSQSEIASGTATLTYTTFGNGNCLPVTDQVVIVINPAPIVNAGEDVFACVDNLQVPLSGSITGSTTTGVWSSTGTGMFLPNAFAMNPSYLASSADSLAGTVTLTLTTTNNGLCAPVADQMTVFILPAGTANAGPDRFICSNNPNVSLSGIIGGAANSGIWTTSGSGIFLPNNTSPSATYVPSEGDITAGSVVLTFAVNSCNQAQDELLITFTPSPQVNAGADITTCSSESEVQLNGFVTGASSTGVWTTSGSGTFVPSANALNAVYQWSAVDAANQVVLLTLTATGIGNCVGVSDQLTLNIFPQGTANAGADQTLCANNPQVQLGGIITGATQPLWTTTGTGSFSPSATVLNPVYQPSAGDLVNGSVNLVLTGVNSCNNATDFLVVNFTPAPTVNAGPDIFVCDDVLPFAINGAVTIAGGGQWSTSGTGVFQNPNALNTFYVASPADISSGMVTLTLTTTGNGNCLPVTDQISIHMNSGILVNAGPDRTACVSASSIQLNGAVSNGSTTGTWTTTGSGFFSPDSNTLNAVYNFSPADLLLESLEFTLTSTNNGICQARSDGFVLTFGNSAYVYAGADMTVCANTGALELSGFVDGETNTGMWSTSGSGTFVPGPGSLNTSYQPSPADVAAGSITITLVSTGSTLCAEGSDQVVITFQGLPQANAGPNVVVCGASEAIVLNGSVQNADGGSWSTSGTGTFVPGNELLSTIYQPTSVDSLFGSITLTLTTIGNGACPGTSDQMVITFAGASVPNAGPSSIAICEDASEIDLTGSLSTPAGFQWSTSGTGSFGLGEFELETTYLPSQADIQAGTVTLYLATNATANCPGGLDSLVVNFDRIPTIDVAASVAACTSSPSVSLSANVAFQDAILWAGNGVGTFSPSNAVANVTYQPSEAEVNSGSSQVTITALNAGACGDRVRTVNISFVQPAVVNAGDDMTICAGQTEVTLNGSVQSASGTGEWTTSGFGTFGTDPTELNATYIVSNTDNLIGFVNFTLTSTSNGPCPAVSDAIQLIIHPAPSLNAGVDQTVCVGTSGVQLNAQSANLPGVEWSTSGDGVFLPSATAPDAEYLFGVSDAQNGTVILTVTGLGTNGCPPVSDDLTVTILTPVVPAFTFPVGCVGVPVQFTDATQILAGTIVSWSWNLGNGVTSVQQNPNVTYNEPGTFEVSLTVRSSLGCETTVLQNITIQQRPVANFTVGINPAPAGFEVSLFNNSTNADLYDWDFGDGFGSSGAANPTYAWMQAGQFTITLTASNVGGCSDSFSRTITINDQVVLPPRLPNSFSPNGDGFNDVFFVRGGPFTQLDFRVYDGWGREVFSSTDQEQGWDGREGGKQSPTGVYVYTVKATTTLGETFEFTGKLNLLR
jgi:gliding motility-associated-like protein